MKQCVRILLFFCSLCLLTGCWDRTEINDMAFVVATAVDKAKNSRYLYSVQVPLPGAMGGAGSSGGGGGTSGKEPFIVEQGTGGNGRQGSKNLQAKLSRRLYFAHRRVLILGEEFAKGGIKSILSEVTIQPQSRISTFLIISKGEGYKILKSQPQMEQYSAEAIREMAKNSLNMTVKDVIEDVDRPGKDPVVPLVEKTGAIKKQSDGKELLMQDFAVFHDDKLAYTTSKKESLGVLWIKEKMQKKSLTFSTSKNEEITVQIIDNNIKTKVDIKNGKPIFNLIVRATGILMENEPDLRMEDPKTYLFVIQHLNKEIKSDILTALNHAHSKSIDIFGFGWNLYRNKNQQWESKWEKNWRSMLRDLQVNVHVDSDIQRMTNTGRKEIKQ